MSHHGHSHGPPAGGGPQIMHGPPGGGLQPLPPRPPPDPVLQAAIEADYKPVTFALGSFDEKRPNSQVLCVEHKKPACTDCGIDWNPLNGLANMFSSAPPDAIIPPPNVIPPQRTQAYTKMKEEGNALFRQKKYVEAVSLYTSALQVANTRPPWEASSLAKEELSLVLGNRSAAFQAAGDYLSALLDAECAIAIRRNWSKGHYRKSKALHALGDLEGAIDAVEIGLQFEPNNVDLETFRKELHTDLDKKKDGVVVKAEPL